MRVPAEHLCWKAEMVPAMYKVHSQYSCFIKTTNNQQSITYAYLLLYHLLTTARWFFMNELRQKIRTFSGTRSVDKACVSKDCVTSILQSSFPGQNRDFALCCLQLPNVPHSLCTAVKVTRP